MVQTNARFSDGKYEVLAHDGDRGRYFGYEVSKLGIRSSLGDAVIAYWDSRNYAFKGKNAGDHLNGKIWVEYDDGDKAWIDRNSVHKLVTI